MTPPSLAPGAVDTVSTGVLRKHLLLEFGIVACEVL